MNTLLILATLVVGGGVALFVPYYGGAAVALCSVLAAGAGYGINRIQHDRHFLLQLFICALLVRVLVSTGIFVFVLQNYFGMDAITYHLYGVELHKIWMSGGHYRPELDVEGYNNNWGMIYVVAGIYSIIGPNMLAVQFLNSVLGAATAPIMYLCSYHIFQNVRVSRLTALFVAFFPSLILWSSQGLKDGTIVFLLAVAMLITLKLSDKLTVRNLVILICVLLSLLSMRFYIFYMVIAAIGGTFIIGARALTANSLFRQIAIMIVAGLAMTYLGVVRTASTQLEAYGSLERVQYSRAGLAHENSGFGKDVDVSTSAGAIKAIPVGAVYLLFAPFPWEIANLRQVITLPEMLLWWSAFPLLVLGLWFAVRYRLRPALPILIFTTMLTLAYSIFQANVGAAYRQRSQLLVFYFMFVAVGMVLLKEKSEERKRKELKARRSSVLPRPKRSLAQQVES